MELNKNSLTGIKDIDRKIVEKLSDFDFLRMCNLTRYYHDSVCDETYFRIRTENKYPETIKYKSFRSWKKHYLEILKYVDLLQKHYDYNYISSDGSPELTYLIHELIPSCHKYTVETALKYVIRKDDLKLLKYLIENNNLTDDELKLCYYLAAYNKSVKAENYLKSFI